MLGISLKNNNAKPISIKKRLILSSISITTLLILLSWIFIVNETRHEIKEVYDARLGQSAKILALTMPSILASPAVQREKLYEYWLKAIQEQSENHESETAFGHPYEQNLIFQFYQNGKVVLKSPTAPDTVLGNTDSSGFGEFTFNNELWRFFQLQIPDKNEQHLYVLVAEKQSIREEIIIEIALSTSLPQLLLIPALAFMILLLVNKFLRPMTELRTAVALRSVDKLEPIVMQRSTVELQPLVNQLNYLLDQLNNAWEREKRFTRTAAHELKTPLAILRLNAENALNTDNIEEQRSDLNKIIIGIDRTDRLIQQLLMHSRIEAQHTVVLTPLNITSTLREVIAQLTPLALQQQQDISLAAIEKCMVNGDKILLSILFTNLIDNAIRYSGANSTISIKMQIEQHSEQEKRLQIYISDNGAKIHDNIRERIFEKFFRAHSERGDGAGLGMSIASDIARHHNGTVKLLPYDEMNANVFVVSLPIAR